MADDSRFNRLLERAQGGDRDAIGEIYEFFAPHMERVTRYRLRKMGLDRVTTADDVRNSVFCQLLKPGAFDSITNAKHLQNFLLKACANKVIDLLAKVTSGQSDARSIIPLHEVEEGAQSDTSDALEQVEELARIYALLSPRERLLCTLRRSGCGWDEIAQRLNTSPVAARQVFSRGYRRAQQLLREPPAASET